MGVEPLIALPPRVLVAGRLQCGAARAGVRRGHGECAELAHLARGSSKLFTARHAENGTFPREVGENTILAQWRGQVGAPGARASSERVWKKLVSSPRGAGDETRFMSRSLGTIPAICRRTRGHDRCSARLISGAGTGRQAAHRSHKVRVVRVIRRAGC